MKKNEMLRRSREVYIARYPERHAAYCGALEHPQPCDTCGGEARPLMAPHPSAELLGWRCYACRRREPA